jgi:hypothetical protein
LKGQTKNVWVLVLFLLAGVVLGGFIGSLFADVPALSWLTYGNKFGLTSPLVLDIGVLTLQFAITIRFTIAGIIGIFVAFMVYRKL